VVGYINDKCKHDFVVITQDPITGRIGRTSVCKKCGQPEEAVK